MKGVLVRWLRRRTDHPSETAEQRRAERAVEEESRKLRKAETETGAIIEAAEKLKALGQANDFAARIKHALGG